MDKFTLKDLTASYIAARKNICNIPNKIAKDSLNNLIYNVLNPLYEKWRKPIVILSGYRSERLNNEIGGRHNSRHIKGEAVDITAIDPDDNKDLMKCLTDSGIIFDQVIGENVNDSGCPQWIHISYTAHGRNKMSVMLSIKQLGKIIYIKKQ